MLLLRFVGRLFLTLAFLSLAFDGIRVLATPGAGLMFASLRDHFATYAKGAEPALHGFILSIGSPFLWDDIVDPLLSVPLSLLCGVLGAAFFLLGYRRPPPEIVTD